MMKAGEALYLNNDFAPDRLITRRDNYDNHDNHDNYDDYDNHDDYDDYGWGSLLFE